MISLDNYIPAWCSYIIVGSLWGCTNPFLKSGQEIIDKNNKNNNINQNNNINKIFDYHIYIPFIINQFGSMLFYILLSNQPLQKVVPIINCLTFLFTVLTATYIGNEKMDSPILLLIGCLFVFLGMYICSNS